MHLPIASSGQVPTTGCVIFGVPEDRLTAWIASAELPDVPFATLPASDSDPFVLVWNRTYIGCAASGVRTRSIVTISPSGSIVHSRCAYGIVLGLPLNAKAFAKSLRAPYTASLVPRAQGSSASLHGVWVFA